jgi:hypothetical protein
VHPHSLNKGQLCNTSYDNNDDNVVVVAVVVVVVQLISPAKSSTKYSVQVKMSLPSSEHRESFRLLTCGYANARQGSPAPIHTCQAQSKTFRWERSGSDARRSKLDTIGI